MPTEIRGDTGVDKIQSSVAVGNILQVVTATKVDSWSTTSDTFTTVSGLSATITPTSTTSKILIIAHISTSRSANSSNWCGDHARMVVNTSTVLPVGTSTGHDQQSLGGGLRYLTNYHATQSTHANLLHEPATTSPLTYEWQVAKENYAGGSVYVNRSGAASTTYSGTAVSTITVMEIGA